MAHRDHGRFCTLIMGASIPPRCRCFRFFFDASDDSTKCTGMVGYADAREFSPRMCGIVVFTVGLKHSTPFARGHWLALRVLWDWWYFVRPRFRGFPVYLLRSHPVLFWKSFYEYWESRIEDQGSCGGGFGGEPFLPRCDTLDGNHFVAGEPIRGNWFLIANAVEASFMMNGLMSSSWPFVWMATSSGDTICESARVCGSFIRDELIVARGRPSRTRSVHVWKTVFFVTGVFYPCRRDQGCKHQARRRFRTIMFIDSYFMHSGSEPNSILNRL